MNIVALIPARAGSKGLPGKNMRRLGGETLVERAATCARQTGINGTICVSTDDPDIIDHAIDIMCSPLSRPPAYAQDTSPIAGVLEHATNHPLLEDADIVLLLQPTSPFRTPGTLRKVIGHFYAEPDTTGVFTVTQVPGKYNLRRQIVFPGEARNMEGFEFPRRQECEKPVYVPDGVCYAVRAEYARKGDLYGPRCVPIVSQPGESLSIDTEEDWALAEWRMRQYEKPDCEYCGSTPPMPCDLHGTICP